MLFVKLGKMIEVVEVRTCTFLSSASDPVTTPEHVQANLGALRHTSLNRVQLLTSCAEVELLHHCQLLQGKPGKTTGAKSWAMRLQGGDKVNAGLRVASYLCIDCETRFPSLWRYDLAYTVLDPFRRNLPHILEWVPKLLLGRSERRRFL